MGLGAERVVLARRVMVIERAGLIFNFVMGMGGWGWLCVFVGGWMGEKADVWEMGLAAEE